MLVYLDESGKLDSKDDIKRPTIAGVLIPETSLDEATRHLQQLKRDLCPVDDYELKANKLLRPSAGGWKIELAERFFSEYLHCIPGLQIIATVCRRPSERLPTNTKMLPLPHIWLMSKVYLYLQEFDDKEMAIFVYDAQDGHGGDSDDRLCRLFTNFLYRHSRGQEYIKRIAPTPLFGKSSLVPGIELADMVAGCLARQADMYEEGKHYNRLEGRKRILLSRYTRYKQHIEKRQANLPEGQYAIQYVGAEVMERVLEHAEGEEVDVSPDNESDVQNG